ncbi:uncharacterized protein LOC121724503 isoform X2 [Alosa sapidissima]|uniref:uncharacterized protein LOC121707712 isoform X2 n=1 Tax=Alosa sapidissima TaxID=34773 RepID=UPI001C093F29|nr:uncharacterized protein LOC121707712 isoform X2 [Alosa sapidissima]XP_041946580.1 uncharacterized protein LOC121707819 isoform X2 [Alosa sapidissima]XP_041967037.1 uncharacterized protein LOC121724503 isoform X2 [Alosa sapidissima]
MGPSAHIFLMRNIIEHRNNQQNNTLLKRQLRRGLQVQDLNSVTLSDLGQVLLGAKTLPDRTSQQSHPEGLQPPVIEVSPQSEPCLLNASTHCGQDCAALTVIVNIRPCRSSWGPNGVHPLQEKLVGNACLRLVQEMVQLQGKDVFIMDLHTPPTWLPPMDCDPLHSLPVDYAKKTLIFPLWTRGHYLLCVMEPLKTLILFMDSMYAKKEQGFGHKPYQHILRALAQRIAPGPWQEQTGLDIEGLPQQHFGVDCGIFMIMYAWYIALETPFDFSIHDMPYLRRWWCTVLMENLEIEGHGRRFAHFTEEGRKTADGSVAPVFRVPRKRKLDTMDGNGQIIVGPPAATSAAPTAPTAAPTVQCDSCVSIEQREESFSELEDFNEECEDTSCEEREERLREIQELSKDYQNTKWLFEEAKKAADWLNENSGLIKNKYWLPRVLDMEAEEQEEVLARQFVQLDVENMNLFTFQFTTVQDHETFSIHVRDELHIRAMTSFVQRSFPNEK